jgi:hypothetical protein
MVIHGRVKNGVVVLDKGVCLREGQEVTVLVPGKPPERAPGEGFQAHSIPDIPAVSLGAVLRPLTSDDDLLSEKLEGRSCLMGWTPASSWPRK